MKIDLFLKRAERGELSPHALQAWSNRLLKTPWSLPSSPEVLKRLARFGIAAYEPEAGEVLLLAYMRSGKGGVWRLRFGGPGPDTQLNAEALRAWRDAEAAVARSLHFMTGSLDRASREPKQVTAISWTASALDGASFGLAMALSLASKAVSRPIPRRFAATGAVDPNGAVEPIEGLTEKIRALCADAPGVTTLLVAAQQREEAEASARGELEIIGVRSVSEAVDSVFRDLSQYLVEIAREPGERDELIDRLFRMAIAGRSASLTWAPIRRVANLLRGRVTDEGQKKRLDFVRAVAARHDGHPKHPDAKSMPLLDDPWYQRGIPPGIRRQIVANVIQHAADVGLPNPQATADFAERWLGRRDACEYELDDLRVMGAYGRLLLTLGRPREALERQQTAIDGWVAYRQLSETSYALCAAFLLAGGLRDRSAYDALCRRDDSVSVKGAFAPTSRAYIDLARGRAATLLGDLDEARQRLESLCANLHIPRHLRFGAIRWSARQVSSPERERLLQPLLDSQDPEAADFQRLARLDGALRGDAHLGPDAALQALRQSNHGELVMRMCSSCPEGMRPAEYVADFFPY